MVLGMWRYNWRDASSALGSSYSLSQSSGGMPLGATLPSIAACGRYLYILNSKEGLLKVCSLARQQSPLCDLLVSLRRDQCVGAQVGTGIVGTHTVRGHVYNYKSKYAGQPEQRSWLVHVNNTLYLKTPKCPFPGLIKINPDSLEVTFTFSFPCGWLM
jgi:hypothetical protein